MGRIWRRRAWMLGFTAVVALVATGCVGFTGTKEVTGGESNGPFVVEISCTHDEGTETTTLTFTADGQDQSTPQTFMESLPPGEITCTIVETEQAGATSVTYFCDPLLITIDPIGGPPNGMSAGGPGASAPGRRGRPTTATCTNFPDRIEVDIFMASEDFGFPFGVRGDSDIHVPFTVTNDFTPAPTTTAPPTTAPPTTAPPAADPAAAQPVAAQPIFTG